MANNENIRKSPSSIEAEKAVLGCMLLNKEAVYKAVQFLVPDAFYDNSNKLIFESMCTMFKQGESVDSVTLIDHLKKIKLLKKVGDSYYITGLVEEAPSSEILPSIYLLWLFFISGINGSVLRALKP